MNSAFYTDDELYALSYQIDHCYYEDVILQIQEWQEETTSGSVYDILDIVSEIVLETPDNPTQMIKSIQELQKTARTNTVYKTLGIAIDIIIDNVTFTNLHTMDKIRIE